MAPPSAEAAEARASVPSGTANTAVQGGEARRARGGERLAVELERGLLDDQARRGRERDRHGRAGGELLAQALEHLGRRVPLDGELQEPGARGAQQPDGGRAVRAELRRGGGGQVPVGARRAGGGGDPHAAELAPSGLRRHAGTPSAAVTASGSDGPRGADHSASPARR